MIDMNTNSDIINKEDFTPRIKFDREQLRCDVEVMGCFFEYVAYKENINMDWFVPLFMESRTRNLMDHGQTRLITTSSPDLFEYWTLLDEINIEEIKRGDNNYKSFELYWIGEMYAFLSSRLNLNSYRIYELINFEKMKNIYLCGHQLTIEGLFERLVENDYFKSTGITKYSKDKYLID